MFHRMTLVSSFLFIFLTCLWGIHIGYVRKADIERYQRAMQTKDIASSNSKTFLSAAEQWRKNVQKDIWFAQEDNSRLHYRIESESSILSMIPKGNKIQLIENLHHMKCWMQDKIYAPSPTNAGWMQQMRYLEADRGIYQYHNQKFSAQTVELSLFRLPGDILPNVIDPQFAFLKGVARDVSFGVSGKTPEFHAEHFKASFKHPHIGGL